MVDDFDLYYLTDTLDDEYDEDGGPIIPDSEWGGFHVEGKRSVDDQYEVDGEGREPLTDLERLSYDEYDPYYDAGLIYGEFDDDEGPESTAEPEGY